MVRAVRIEMASRRIELNVGGTSFTVGRDTIMKHPNSLLAKMFTQDDDNFQSESKKRKLEPAQNDCKCAYFIDR